MTEVQKLKKHAKKKNLFRFIDEVLGRESDMFHYILF